MTESRSSNEQQMDATARGLAAVIAATEDLNARRAILENVVQGGADARTIAGLVWWLAYWVDRLITAPDSAPDEIAIAADVPIGTTPERVATLYPPETR